MNELIAGIITLIFGSITEFKDVKGDKDPITVNGITISKLHLDAIQALTVKEFEPLKFYQWKDSIIDTTNYGHWDSTMHGLIMFDVPEAEARTIFNDFYNKIIYEGNYLYLTHLYFDSLKNSYFDIAIVKVETQYDVVKRVGTQSKNHDISNEQVIEKLKEWDKKVRFKIMVVDVDRIEAYMGNEAWNVKKFAREVSEFCPDIIDQGYGSLDAMIKDYKANKYFWLWWD